MKSRVFSASLLTLSLLSFQAFAADVYVSKNNIHEDVDGILWGTYQTDDGVDHDAYTDLQAAVSAAKNNDTIWIEDGFVCDEGYTEVASGSNGTYKYRIYSTRSLTLRSRSGSYESGTTIKGQWHSESTPKGVDAIQCIRVGSGKLIGLNILNGATPSSGYMPGAGVYGNCQIEKCFIANCYAGYNAAWNNASSVRDSVVSNCQAITCGTFGPQCNIYNSLFINNPINGNGINGLSSSTISNCQFVGNSSGWIIHGSGAKESRGGRIVDCLFENNSAYSVGCRYAGSDRVAGTITNCIFRNNTGTPISQTSWGGKATNTLVYVYNSFVTNNVTQGNAIYHSGEYYNCLIAGNTVKDSIVSTPDPVYSNIKLFNCTVAGNISTSGAGGLDSSSAEMVNTVVFGNTGKNGTVGKVASAINCCLDDDTEATTEEGCIRENPLLLAPQLGYFVPAMDSPLIGAGSMSACDLTEFDLGGRPRVVGGKVSIGAFEVDPSIIYFDYEAEFPEYLVPPAKVKFYLKGSDIGGDVTFNWDFDRDGVVDYVSYDNSFTYTFASGEYDPLVTITSGSEEYSISDSRPFTIRENIHHVDINSTNPQAPYMTRETAALNPLDVIPYVQDGDEVVIHPGTYEIASQICVTNGIAFYGATGKSGDVVINSQGTDRCLFISGKKNTIVHSLTLSGGYRHATFDYGGNVLIAGTDVPKGNEHNFTSAPGHGILSNAVVRNGRAASKFAVCGGIFASGENALITHSVISNNYSNGAYVDGGQIQGAALHLVNGATVQHSLIARNSTGAYSRSPWQWEEWESYQEGHFHSAVYLSGNARARFCTIAGNTTSYCGGVNIADTGIIDGCIIADNIIRCKSLIAMNVPRYNVISFFAGNVPTLYGKGDIAQYQQNFYDFVAAEATRAATSAVSINGNIVDAEIGIEGANPIVATLAALFKNPQIGDYTLKAGSPAIDGIHTTESMPQVDLNGNPRLMRGAYDYGCFEYQRPFGTELFIK